MLREEGCAKDLDGPYAIRSNAIMDMFRRLNQLINESRSTRQRVGNSKEEAKANGAALEESYRQIKLLGVKIKACIDNVNMDYLDKNNQWKEAS